MDWRMKDEDRQALLEASKREVNKNDRDTLAESYAAALGYLQGTIEIVLKGLERIDPEDEDLKGAEEELPF